MCYITDFKKKYSKQTNKAPNHLKPVLSTFQEFDSRRHSDYSSPQENHSQTEFTAI